MPDNKTTSQASIPSVDRLLNDPGLAEVIDAVGRGVVVEAAREVLAEVRVAIATDGEAAERMVGFDYFAGRIE